jgi:hypothetical protein
MNRLTLSDWLAAAGIAVLLFVVYNANGREIGSYDSQPTKYAARELLLRGTLSLNHVVGRTPQLAERPAFVTAENGRYRSAYSPVPSIAAAAIVWPIWKAGLLDLRTPWAPTIIAVVAASTLTAVAVALAFLTARRFLPARRAAVLAAALGLGTGYWSTVSQTLWQHETAAFGLALFVLAFATFGTLSRTAVVVAGIGLGIAGTSRPQLAPAIAVLLAGLFFVAGLRSGLITAAIVAVFAAALITVHVRWFGTPLGAIAQLEALHPAVHATEQSFNFSAAGFLGLLVSPNRGLLIFTPITLMALGGIRQTFVRGPRSPLLWCLLAAFVQYLFYGAYSVWWGGHTYGPRYMLDVLPLLVPLGAVALASIRFRSVRGGVGSVALAWSITTAATGAFFYPHDRWNIDPYDVDRHHERLWQWSDMQFARCWQRGPSPQNFDLFRLTRETRTAR